MGEKSSPRDQIEQDTPTAEVDRKESRPRMKRRPIPIRAAAKLRRLANRERLAPNREEDRQTGRWGTLGAIGSEVIALNRQIAVVQTGHWFSIVGHYRGAHVEAGPYPSVATARVEWQGIRHGIEQWRRGARGMAVTCDRAYIVGPGVHWAPQHDRTRSCPGCVKRVAAGGRR